ncbi:MAG: ATP-binding cassette domain-containing protein [Filifactor alocis]|nr:ATP-binding cassette domain-containing protein [Filifactor alocis]
MKNIVETNDVVIDIEMVSKVYKVKEKSNGKILKRIFSPSNYKNVVAIDEASFQISRGEFIGLVGNNGAGKSTLVKMMTGILYNTSGQIKVLGNDPYKKRLENNKRMSVVFGQRTQLRWDLSPLDSFRLLKVIYDIEDRVYDENLKKFIELFEMEPFIKQPVRTLSLGQKMKCEITAAFLHDPEIVLLDEPTIGLDIFSKDAIIGFLNEMKASRNVTILLTTHDMNEISQVCDRVIFLDKGRVIVDENINRLMEINISKSDVSVLTHNRAPVKIQCDFELNTNYSDYKIEIKQVENERIFHVIAALMEHNQIKDITIEKESFTDIVKKIYEVKNN